MCLVRGFSEGRRALSAVPTVRRYARVAWGSRTSFTMASEDSHWEEFYLGSRQFQFIADGLGMPIDQVNQEKCRSVTCNKCIQILK